jgi:hypothetical protein
MDRAKVSFYLKKKKGNLAHEWAKNGNKIAFENKEFSERHSSLWRLTDIGREQTLSAGEYIKNNLGKFDSFYTVFFQFNKKSEFIRYLFKK